VKVSLRWPFFRHSDRYCSGGRDDFAEQTLAQLDLRPKYKASAPAVAKDERKTKGLAPLSTTTIEPGDIVLMACKEDAVQKIIIDLGWQPEPDVETFIEESSPENDGVIEGIITSRSSVNEQTLGEFKIKELFGIDPLAVMQGTDIRIQDPDGIVLKPGDAVLLYGGWDNLRPAGNRFSFCSIWATITKRRVTENIRVHSALISGFTPIRTME
jgi:Trk K+ transport system NAD-binding subunit